MSVPVVPLPTLTSLAQAVVPLSRPLDWLCPKPEGFELRLYGRSTIALADAVEAARRAGRAARAALWLPSYFCNGALSEVRRNNIRLAFYPLGADLGPDWQALDALSSARDEQGVFLLVHFFGFPGPVAAAAEFCRRRGLELVEDAAHVLSPTGAVGSGSGGLLLSPWKLLPTPAGAVLRAPYRWSGRLPPIDTLPDFWQSSAWWARRLTQHSLHLFGLPVHRRRAAAAEPAPAPPRTLCGPWTRRALFAAARRRHAAVERRRRNYEFLAGSLPSRGGLEPFFPRLPPAVCPYCLPLRTGGRAGEAVKILERRGVPATQWPDLAPEVLRAEGGFSEALELWADLVFIPVHQSLTERDLRAAVRALRAAAEELG